VKARRVKKLDPRATLAENAARIVAVRVAELRSFTPRALDPAEVDHQHDMRIAAKRLRYVLEATGFCFGRAGAAARSRAKEIQDLLGEVHDADVMLPRLHAHRSLMRGEDAEAVLRRAVGAEDLDPALAARAPHRTTYRGLEVLEVYLVARRTLLFERFVAHWEESEEKGVWRALERAADRELERAAEIRRQAERAERARAALAAAEEARREAEALAAKAAAELAEAERDRA
jgi:CHAD domain-containing protein